MIEVQELRGTATQVAGFTGPIGLLTVDTTNWLLYLHDGATAGGHLIGVMPPGGGLTAHAVLLGEGTGALGYATIGTANRVLVDNGASADPSFTTLTALIDTVFGNAEGSILQRGSSGWQVLTPATSGQFLQTQGASALAQWAAPSIGSLASVANNTVMANISGGSAPPAADGLSAVIDACIGGNNGDMLLRESGSWSNQRPKYLIGFSFTGGLLANNQLLGLHQVAKAITIPANFGAYLGLASQASGTANATGSPVINVNKLAGGATGSSSSIGTITIGAGSVTPSFATTSGTAKSLSQGDVVEVIGPSSADASFANFLCTIVAYET